MILAISALKHIVVTVLKCSAVNINQLVIGGQYNGWFHEIPNQRRWKLPGDWCLNEQTKINCHRNSFVVEASFNSSCNQGKRYRYLVQSVVGCFKQFTDFKRGGFALLEKFFRCRWREATLSSKIVFYFVHKEDSFNRLKSPVQYRVAGFPC